jgi:hypothetical protein
MKVNLTPAFTAEVESHPTDTTWRILLTRHYVENGDRHDEVIWAGEYVGEDAAVWAAAEFNKGQMADA